MNPDIPEENPAPDKEVEVKKKRSILIPTVKREMMMGRSLIDHQDECVHSFVKSPALIS